MKELISNRADEIALTIYDKDFYEPTKAQQDEIWKLAEQASQDYLASQIGAAREKKKYEYPGA